VCLEEVDVFNALGLEYRAPHERGTDVTATVQWIKAAEGRNAAAAAAGGGGGSAAMAAAAAGGGDWEWPELMSSAEFGMMSSAEFGMMEGGGAGMYD
jgi:hypothetical protein